MNTCRNYETATLAFLPKIGSNYAIRKQNQKEQEERFAASGFKHRRKQLYFKFAI